MSPILCVNQLLATTTLGVGRDTLEPGIVVLIGEFDGEQLPPVFLSYSLEFFDHERLTDEAREAIEEQWQTMGLDARLSSHADVDDLPAVLAELRELSASIRIKRNPLIGPPPEGATPEPGEPVPMADRRSSTR